MIKAVGNTLRLAVVATLIGFLLGSLFGFVAGYFRDSLDRQARLGPVGARRVSVPHYWLGMVLVIIFAAAARLAAADRRRPGRLERLDLGLGAHAPPDPAGASPCR